jgi:hypothetical protein
MAGLINKKMAGSQDETNEQEPVEGTGPDGSAQHEGMEGEAPEASDTSGQGGEVDANNPAFLAATKLAMQALYEKGAAQDVAKQLRATSDHVKALSDIAYEMTSVIDEKTEGQVPDELIMMLAIKVLTEVGDIAEAAGIQVSAQDIAGAFKDMLLRFLGENGMDTSQLQQAMDQIDPKVFEEAQQGA